MNDSTKSAAPGSGAGKARKAIAFAMIGVGAAVLLALLTYGGPIFPHVAGPAVLIALGAILLVLKRKAGKDER